ALRTFPALRYAMDITSDRPSSTTMEDLMERASILRMELPRTLTRALLRFMSAVSTSMRRQRLRMRPPCCRQSQTQILRLRFRTDGQRDRKSTRLNSSHEWISYAVFCLKKKKK